MKSLAKKEKVSVIIPTYNRAHLISETIESIINQSFRPAEIIIIDDGSTDDTNLVVKNYAKFVRYFRINNSGVCVARNVGVRIARNEWIAFCDSDDLWHQDKLYHQVEFINNSDECEYCFTNFRIIEETTWSKSTKFDDSPAGFWNISHKDIDVDAFIITEPLYPKLLVFNPIFPSTVIMKKTFFNRIGGFNELFSKMISEDFEFSLRCVQDKYVGVIRKPLVGIRKHGQNISRGRMVGVSFILGDIEILKYSLENHFLGKQHAHLINREIIYRSISVAHGAFALGEFNLFREILKNIPAGSRSLKMWVKAAIVLVHLFAGKQKKLTNDLKIRP